MRPNASFAHFHCDRHWQRPFFITFSIAFFLSFLYTFIKNTREGRKKEKERERCELNWTRCWSHVSCLGPGCTEGCTGAFSQPVPPKAPSFFSPSPPSWGLGNIHSIGRNPPHKQKQRNTQNCPCQTVISSFLPSSLISLFFGGFPPLLLFSSPAFPPLSLPFTYRDNAGLHLW